MRAYHQLLLAQWLKAKGNGWVTARVTSWGVTDFVYHTSVSLPQE